MIEITDEVVELVAELIIDATDECSLRRCSPSMLTGQCECRDNARLALTAVAPLIAAAEREANAKVAEAMQQVIGALPGSSISSTCVEIAAAIRARGGEA